MHIIRHFYYQNKKKIWTIIVVVVVIIVIINLLNYLLKQRDITNNKQINDNIIENINGKENTNAIISDNKSLVDGTPISSNSLKTAKELINNFVSYCNNGEVEQAYELLTEECKEELYPTLEIFKKNYWQGLFNKKKVAIIENWINSTYKVTIIEDMLATGNTTDTNKYIEYVTLVEKNKSYKLNINNYIGRTEINKTNEKNSIEIKVISKDTYMDYEIYNLQVNNKSEKNIILDTLQNSDTIYLQDEKEIKYKAYNYKLQANDITINQGTKKNIEITFSNGYTTGRKIEYLVFSKLISNYRNDVDINNQETYTFYIDI